MCLRGLLALCMFSSHLVSSSFPPKSLYACNLSRNNDRARTYDIFASTQIRRCFLPEYIYSVMPEL